jgi:hypothetical protein
MEDDILDAVASPTPTPNTPPTAHINPPTYNKQLNNVEILETNKNNKITNSSKSYVQSSIASYVAASATPTPQEPQEAVRLARLRRETMAQNKPTHSKQVSTNPNSFSTIFADSAVRPTPTTGIPANNPNTIMTDNTPIKHKPLGTVTLGVNTKSGPFNRRPPPGRPIPTSSPFPTLSPTTTRVTPPAARPTNEITIPQNDFFKPPLPHYIMRNNTITRVDDSFRISTMLANLPQSMVDHLKNPQPLPTNTDTNMAKDIESSNEATPMSTMDTDSDVSITHRTSTYPTIVNPYDKRHNQTMTTVSHTTVSTPSSAPATHSNSEYDIIDPPVIQPNHPSKYNFLANKMIETTQEYNNRMSLAASINPTNQQTSK